MVGIWRHLAALTKNCVNKHGASEENGWQIHIIGAHGELVFAKGMGFYWDFSVNKFRMGGDVGDIQVRTRSKLWHELKINHEDRNDDLFVLVLGLAPDFYIGGCMYGREAKQTKGWLKEHGGREEAFFVPQANLHDLSRYVVPAPHSPIRTFWRAQQTAA